MSESTLMTDKILRRKTRETAHIVQRIPDYDSQCTPSKVSDEEVQVEQLVREPYQINAAAKVEVKRCTPQDVAVQEVTEQESCRDPVRNREVHWWYIPLKPQAQLSLVAGMVAESQKT